MMFNQVLFNDFDLMLLSSLLYYTRNLRPPTLQACLLPMSHAVFLFPPTLDVNSSTIKHMISDQVLKHESQKCKSPNNSAQNKNSIGTKIVNIFNIVAIFGIKIAGGGGVFK